MYIYVQNSGSPFIYMFRIVGHHVYICSEQRDIMYIYVQNSGTPWVYVQNRGTIFIYVQNSGKPCINMFRIVGHPELKTLECDILNPDLLTFLEIKFHI